MKKVYALIVCGLLLACTEQADKVSEALASKANAVITDIQSEDDATVAECESIVAECDAESDATCVVAAAMDKQCAALETGLEDVRQPAVDCWRGVASCDENAGEDCESLANDCDHRDNDRHRSRQPIVDCSRITEECLAEAAAAGEDSAVCDDVIAHCEKVSELAVDGEQSRFRGDQQGEEMCDRAREMVEEGKDYRQWSEEKATVEGDNKNGDEHGEELNDAEDDVNGDDGAVRPGRGNDESDIETEDDNDDIAEDSDDEDENGEDDDASVPADDAEIDA